MEVCFSRAEIEVNLKEQDRMSMVVVSSGMMAISTDKIMSYSRASLHVTSRHGVT